MSVLSHRRSIGLQKGVVANALPEHFSKYYPKLVSFLDAYYEFLSEDDTHKFDDLIGNLIKSHDMLGVDLGMLEFAMSSVTMGFDYSTSLSDARLKAQLFARYYRTKGSLYSIETFFRWLYGEDAIVEYGKDKVFYLNHEPSKVGTASLRKIKNDKLYQTFALLIKVGVPISAWRDTYKQFAHPAGMYFQGEVVIESTADLGIREMTAVVLDSDAGVITLETGLPTIGIDAYTSVTGLYPDDSDSDGDQQRIEFNTKVSDLDSLTISQLHANYQDIEDVIDANSPTFDAIDDGYYKSVKFSSTVETMDQDIFDLVTVGDDNEFLLADSDAALARFDDLIHTMDNVRLTMDRTS